MINYEENAKILKVLSDPNRLKIIDILSCGEICACDILEYFDFTQPTLSHHMKVLSDSGIVSVRKEGLWNYYTLNNLKCNEVIKSLMSIINEKEDCICRVIGNKECR